MARSKYLDMDASELINLKGPEMKTALKSIAKVVNSRMSRLQKTEGGADAPAMKSVARGTIKTGGNYARQRSEMARAARFLKHSTSTVRSFHKLQKTTAQRIGSNVPIGEGAADYWKAYRQIEELDPVGVKNYGSNEVQRMLAHKMEQKDMHDAISDVLNKLTQSYEEEQLDEEEEDDTGEWFE